MKKTKKQEIQIRVLDELLNNIPEKEYKRTENRMLLAARIDDGLTAKGWRQRDLAKALGKKDSVISKWLSGTHNFTVETLWDIEEVLDINLINIYDTVSEMQVIRFEEKVITGSSEIVNPKQAVWSLAYYDLLKGSELIYCK